MAASLLIQGIDKGAALLLVPMLLHYLDQTQYGVWLTIMSIVSMFGFMNVGLGNGLRNKFAVAIANNEDKKAKTYVSTTYAILSIIIASFFLIFLIANWFIPWASILNVTGNSHKELSALMLIVFGFFSLRFVGKLVTMVIVADQRPAIRDAVRLVGKILILLTVFLLTLTPTSSLIYIGLAYTGLPVLVLVFASVYFYTTRYKKYSPSYSYIDFKYAKDLAGLGVKFFIIQVSIAILFMSDNIIIAQLFGPAEVTPYQIAGKYFKIVSMIFSVLLSPMWSAYTEAYEKKDFKWIKKLLRKQEKAWYVIIVIVIGMILISQPIFSLWVGNEVQIGIYLSISWGGFVILQNYNRIYTLFLNGIGKIKLQMITAISSIIINIPLSILFAKILGLGIKGVILATCFSILIYSVTRKIQVAKILNGTAKGIWNE